MSQSAGDHQAEPQGERSSQPSPSSEPEATSIESAWLEAEQELSLDSSRQSPLSEQTRSPDPAATVRSFDPSSPLILVETAFLASAASLIWFVNYYFPMGPLLRIFFPIPIALIYLRWGQRSAWMGALVSGLLLSVLMGPARSVLFVMPFGFMGVLLGLLWQRRAGWGISIALGAILGSFGFFFRIWLVSLLLGDDLWLYATTQVTQLVDWVCIKLGIVFQPTLALIQVIAIIMVIINNLVYLFIVHLVAWFLLDRLNNPIPRPPKWVQVLMEYEGEA
ncbi:DUF2232 domain-containing protein [Pantanalinema rosaneae CENA516]|uniref:DUF2232 domain-containing protein n=1 Tax=Pantanalinema rosaneae TaxID=1620701 RepID=UPI003D700B1F